MLATQVQYTPYSRRRLTPERSNSISTGKRSVLLIPQAEKACFCSPQAEKRVFT